MGPCQQGEPGQAAGGAALFLNNDFMELTWIFFWKLHLCQRNPSAGLCFLFLAASLERLPRSQELLTAFCYLELSEPWLQLIWQRCCHGNEDFIVHYLLLAQGEKSNFSWLLPLLEKLVKQAPPYWGFVAAFVKALGRKM